MFRCRNLHIVIYSLLSVMLFAIACASSVPTGQPLRDITSTPLKITVLHVGDTHSYVIPHDVMLKINGQKTLAVLGGWTTLASALQEIRVKDENLLLLHAGDVTGGTIWSHKFEGTVDFAAMNALKFDAVIPGNRELARGTATVLDMAETLTFPVLAANLDLSAEPLLAARIMPYTIVEYDGEEIGIIGLVTSDMMDIGSPDKTVKLLPSEEAASKYIRELNSKGINKIVVLSHIGYERDVRLAKTVPGIDIIVGGHSHTLMGGQEFAQVGLTPDMPYPTETTGPTGDRVLIVHAWENNHLLGQVTLNFDDHGRIDAYNGQPFIFATGSFKIEDDQGWSHLCSCQSQYTAITEETDGNSGFKTYWSNQDMDTLLQPYISQAAAELNAVVVTADEDLIRGFNTGPGPLVADAFLWSARKVDPGVRMAIYDTYNVDADLFKGAILTNDIHMLLARSQNLVTFTAKGSLLKTILEIGVDSHIRAQMPPPCYEISGLKMTLDMSRESGDRITGMQVEAEDGSYAPVNMSADYTVATTDFLAEKGMASVLSRLSWVGPLADTIEAGTRDFLKYRALGISDVEAMTDYLRIQKNLQNPTSQRMTLILPGN